jgi:hypothetical protein
MLLLRWMRCGSFLRGSMEGRKVSSDGFAMSRVSRFTLSGVVISYGVLGIVGLTIVGSEPGRV